MQGSHIFWQGLQSTPDASRVRTKLRQVSARDDYMLLHVFWGAEVLRAKTKMQDRVSDYDERFLHESRKKRTEECAEQLRNEIILFLIRLLISSCIAYKITYEKKCAPLVGIPPLFQ